MSGNQFILRVAGLEPELTVVAFRGRERLSRCFRFDLEVDAPTASEPSALLGQAARLELSVGGKSRLVVGLIAGVTRGEVLADGRRRLRLRLAPKLSVLAHRRMSRVFQDLTVGDIVGRVLGEHGVAFRAELHLEHPKREYCVQHDESDLAFVSRLSAEEGIAFRFDAPDAEAPLDTPEVVVFFDTCSTYPPLRDGARMAYRPVLGAGDGMVREEHHVSVFLERQRQGSQGAILSDFDLLRPTERATASDPKAELVGLGTVHYPHGLFGEAQVRPLAPIVANEQVRRDAIGYRGASLSARLTAGARFELEDHEDPSLSGAYAVVDVSHDGVAAFDGDTTYRNRFRAVAASFLLRPERPRRRVIQSLETATVTGPVNEEIHTDALGRVRVLFHWDLLGAADATSSCWIRVAQAWAGTGWGAQFIPRVGMEVLVGFLGGDPDRPIVMGCVPNATHPPAFPLPANSTRAGIRSRSTPDGPDAGSSEVSFEDAAGAERLNLLAHRDLDMVAGNDMRAQVTGDHSLLVAGDDQIVVSGARHVIVKGPGRTSLGAGGSLSVEGDLREEIHGSRSSEVDQNIEEKISGSIERTIVGDVRETVQGSRTLHAESIYTLVVGSHDRPGHSEIQILGTSTQTVEDSATIEARTSLTLRCGESRLVLSPRSIDLYAPSVSVSGIEVTMKGDGPSLELTDKARILSKSLKLYGETSSVELGKEAEIKGEKVLLNCKAQPPMPTDDQGTPQTKKLSVRLTDALAHPYAGKHYELRSEGFRLEGTTNDDGLVEHDLPKSARVAHVELWVETYPTGRRQTYVFVLEEMAPIESPEGLRVRLKNLGYYEGPTEGDHMGEPTAAALRRFQREHELEPSGLDDEATRGALLARHGN